MLENVLPLVTYCTLMAATPGPNTVMLTASGANYGYIRTVPHLLGIAGGLTAMTVAACFGLGALFQRHPQLNEALRVLGALYIVYLAWRVAGAKVSAGAESARPLTFIESALFQLLNPKSWIRSVTLATVFMPTDVGLAAGVLFVSLVGLAVGLVFMSIWTLFGVAIRQQLQSPVRMKVFNLVMCLSLLALAFSFVIPRN